MSSVRVKICGITRVEDAEAAVAHGADFLGLNFWERSPRRLDPERGKQIADSVRGRTSLVGVFVNQPPDLVREIAARVELDLVQFHGDEPAAELRPWGARAVKAIRFVGELDAEALDDYGTVWGFVVEPRSAEHGGTGRSWDYAQARRLPRKKPFLLAGGLGPANIAEAVAVANPWGVDVCSGVESAPGVKDAEAMWKLFAEVDGAGS